MSTIRIHYNAKTIVGRIHSSIYNNTSQHIYERRNTIDKLISSDVISINYVKSKVNLMDLITKGLFRYQVYCLSRRMTLGTNI